MYESRAIGGPLNGVKLCAPGTWEGLIRKEFAPAHTQASKYYHPGRYVWVGFDGWTWKPGRFVKIPGCRPDAARNWRMVIE